jgi:hypothetical protein
MRFQRTPRYGDYELTPRKAALARTRPQRAFEREKARLPLLADQLAPPPALHFDPEAERLQRERRHREIEERMRGFEARVWREARRDAQAASPETRAAIRAAWNAWTGPATALYFRWVVDEHTGANEARRLASIENARKIRDVVLAGMRAQTSLDLGARP